MDGDGAERVGGGFDGEWSGDEGEGMEDLF
jgi:hypothetical protein